MKKYSKKQIVHCILVTACMFIVSGVWIAISTKNDLEPFFNDARSRLEEKYQRTVQIDRYTSDYHGAEAVQVRFADEPEVEFFAWENNDTYFEAYLAWDATRMLKGAFPDFTVRADVCLGVMRKVMQTDFGFIRKTAEPLHGRMPNAGTASLLFFCGLTRRFPRRNA